MIAITGYEVDIVRVAADGTETLVDCREQYNHHYSGWMHGKGAANPESNTGKKCADGKDSENNCRGTAGRRLTEDEDVIGPHGKPLPRFVATGASAGTEGFPNVQAFSEGNGNEHRASFKGYPKGYAQLLASPTTWINSPMIINTSATSTRPSPVTSEDAQPPVRESKKFQASRAASMSMLPHWPGHAWPPPCTR